MSDRAPRQCLAPTLVRPDLRPRILEKRVERLEFGVVRRSYLLNPGKRPEAATLIARHQALQRLAQYFGVAFVHPRTGDQQKPRHPSNLDRTTVV